MVVADGHGQLHDAAHMETLDRLWCGHGVDSGGGAAGAVVAAVPAVLQGYAADALKAGSLHFLNAPEMAVSSTEIRRKIQAGADISGDVPSAVRQYILQHGLYREYSG